MLPASHLATNLLPAIVMQNEQIQAPRAGTARSRGRRRDARRRSGRRRRDHRGDRRGDPRVPQPDGRAFGRGVRDAIEETLRQFLDQLGARPTRRAPRPRGLRRARPRRVPRRARPRRAPGRLPRRRRASPGGGCRRRRPRARTPAPTGASPSRSSPTSTRSRPSRSRATPARRRQRRRARARAPAVGRAPRRGEQLDAQGRAAAGRGVAAAAPLAAIAGDHGEPSASRRSSARAIGARIDGLASCSSPTPTARAGASARPRARGGPHGCVGPSVPFRLPPAASRAPARGSSFASAGLFRTDAAPRAEHLLGCSSARRPGALARTRRGQPAPARCDLSDCAGAHRETLLVWLSTVEPCRGRRRAARSPPDRSLPARPAAGAVRRRHR